MSHRYSFGSTSLHDIAGCQANASRDLVCVAIMLRVMAGHSMLMFAGPCTNLILSSGHSHGQSLHLACLKP